MGLEHVRRSGDCCCEITPPQSLMPSEERWRFWDGYDGTVVGMWLECHEGISIFAVRSQHSERWSAKRGSDECRLMESGMTRGTAEALLAVPTWTQGHFRESIGWLSRGRKSRRHPTQIQHVALKVRFVLRLRAGLFHSSEPRNISVRDVEVVDEYKTSRRKVVRVHVAVA